MREHGRHCEEPRRSPAFDHRVHSGCLCRPLLAVFTQAPRLERPRKSQSLLAHDKPRVQMSNTVKPKAAAAKRGCLTARHWRDIRQAARLARSEGVTLIMHGVTVGPAARGKETLPQPQSKPLSTTGHGGRGQRLTESVSLACEHPPSKQHERQEEPKAAQRQLRSLMRLSEFQQAKACGARWLPLVWGVLRGYRAKSRDNVWTQHMERKIELHKKARDFLGRALQLFRSRAVVVGDLSEGTPASPSGHIAALVRALR